MIPEAEYQFKIVIVGNSSVGKSSILKRFADDEFKESYLATIGVDFRFKTVTVRDKLVKLQIWDTAGQERFRTITSAYYKNAQGIIVVFDLLSQKSFDDVDGYWYGQIDKYADSDAEVMIFGNKSDMSERIVSRDEVNTFAQYKKAKYHEVSARTGDEVNEAIIKMAGRLVDKHPPLERKEGTDYRKSVLESIKEKKSKLSLQGGSTSKGKSSCKC